MFFEIDGEGTPVVSTEQVAEPVTQVDTATVAEKTEEAETPKTATTEETKSFTQEMVDEIVRNRLERERKATFKRYGVEDRDGLDSLIGKSQSYDIMKERYDAIKEENGTLKEKMAFITNNINPAREEDVRAYFKGKGIEFNETNLINELATHPEWLNVKEVNKAPQTTITSLGVEHKPVSHAETEDERQRRIFGV